MQDAMPADPRAARPTTLADLPRVRRLLAERSGIPDHHPTIRADHLQWKYLDPRDDCSDPRSWVVEQDGEIVAHMAVWPHWLITPGGEIPSLHGLDWAARRGAGGAGALVCATPVERRGAACISGGSEDADRVLATIGFRKVTELHYWARPARPLRQMRTRAAGSGLARLPRSIWWRWWPPAPAARWNVTAVTPDAVPADLWPRPEPGIAMFRRSAAFYHWLVRCPISPVQLYVAQGASGSGYFALARVPGVARIVDAWTHSTDVRAWSDLYAAAWHTAIADPDVCEVSTLTGLARCREALWRTGFRERGSIPLRLAGRASTLAASREFAFQWVDGDKCIWHNGTHDYDT